MGLDIIHILTNIRFKLFNIEIFKITANQFFVFGLFKFCFENSTYQVMIISQTNCKRRKTKQERLLPLKHVCITYTPEGNPSLQYFPFLG